MAILSASHGPERVTCRCTTRNPPTAQLPYPTCRRRQPYRRVYVRHVRPCSRSCAVLGMGFNWDWRHHRIDVDNGGSVSPHRDPDRPRVLGTDASLRIAAASRNLDQPWSRKPGFYGWGHTTFRSAPINDRCLPGASLRLARV